ncbi:MAG: hypothetical protein IPF61_02805 [Xanthomonadales bacterium]|nr:hypothetical protein [Xanthomonadales bacterium]
MATYNQVDFLAEAVQGVMKQIVDFPLELIIGDDCSTDGTYVRPWTYSKSTRE